MAATKRQRSVEIPKLVLVAPSQTSKSPKTKSHSPTQIHCAVCGQWLEFGAIAIRRLDAPLRLAHTSCFTPSIPFVDVSELREQNVSEKTIAKVLKEASLAEADSEVISNFIDPLLASFASLPPLFFESGQIDFLSSASSSSSSSQLNESMEALNLFLQRENSEATLVRLPFADDGERDAAMETILKACSAAPFGLKNETVFDSAVRYAYQLEPRQFAVSGWHPAESVLQQVQRTLWAGGAVRCELYRLNVYTTGGMFKSHVDTPSTTSMFGSLVVCLPVAFTGGQLLVRHRQHVQTFDWAPQSAGRLQWAAFFGDCQHEILPVTSGYRVTLAYRLYSDDRLRPPKPSTGAVCSSWQDIRALLGRCLASSAFLPDGGWLGFYTQHGYAHTSRCMQSLLHPAVLKGVDAVVHALLSEHSPNVLFLPAYSFDDNARVFIRNGFQQVFESESAYEDQPSPATRFDPLLSLPNLVWLNTSSVEHSEIGEYHAYWGNEATVNCSYCWSVLLAFVPDSGARHAVQTVVAAAAPATNVRVCMYGEQCRRHATDHFREFAHPWWSAEEIVTRTTMPDRNTA